MTLMQDESVESLGALIERTDLHKPQQNRAMRKFINAVRQIGEVVDEESQALGSHTNPDFHDIKTRKARGLQSLTLALDDMERGFLEEALKKDIQSQLDSLQSKLLRNQRLLQTHMEAVGELVEMIHAAAHDQETDGTYDPFHVAVPVVRKQSLHKDGSHSD